MLSSLGARSLLAGHGLHRRLVRFVAGVVLLSPIACASPFDPNTGACRQTGEFGNTGCIEIRGIVIDQNGAPQTGISVGPRFLPGRDVFNTVYVTTGLDGHFKFRVSRHSGGPPMSGPDTTSLFVHAADPQSAGVGMPATVRDSVLGQATIAPVGRVPEPLEVTIQLMRE
jgi:hypothetical protein